MSVDYDLSSEAVTPRATRLSEAMHRCLFEEAADGIIIADGATARFLEANPRAEELTGYSRGELLQMSMADLIAPESLAEQRLRWGALRDDSVIFAERVLRRKDGSLFVAELSGRKLSDGSVVGFLRDISQRKQLQAELHISEARYRLAVHASPDIIAEVDVHGHLQMLSPSASVAFRCCDERPLLGRHVFELLAPQERSRAQVLLASYRDGSLKEMTSTLWLQRDDGEPMLCEVSASPIQDDAGAVLAHALFARDVTERSRSEAKIQHLSRLYSLLSHVNQAVIRSREQRDLFQTVCDVAVEHGGFRMAWIGVVDQASGRVEPVAHAGGDASYLCDLDISLRDPDRAGGPAGVALREQRLVVCHDIAQDPSMAPWREQALARGYRTLASVALQVGGRSVAALTVYWDRVGFFSGEEKRLMQELGEDISAALAFMEAQAERHRAELALRASEERFRSLVQNSMDGIAAYAVDGAVLYHSPAVERILGYGARELLGRNIFELVHADDSAQARTDLETLVRNEGCSIKRDRRYRHRDGSYRWIESVATNLLHVPSVAALVDNFRDVSERKQAEEERQQLLAELTHAQKLESIGRLAGGVAHDFNNMLAVILGSVELALRDPRTHTQVQGYLREIRDAGTRSAQLTRQLLSFARKHPAEPKVVEVNRVVEGALQLLRRLIGENVTLQWRPGSGVWQIEIDPTQLGQVLTNLTVNSRDAISDEGVGMVTIETANETFDAVYCAHHPDVVQGDYVRLSVSDTGAGMSPEVQAHIFEPFFSTKGPGSGTGLGLATVYGIAKQSSGFVRVYSQPGEGARFDVYLPRYVDSTLPQHKPIAALSAPTPRAACILVVEDEVQVLSLVTTLLRNLGYAVVSAGSPQAALDIVQGGQIKPDVLLTDVIMPSMNGVELARVLRTHQPALKSIFMSGYMADAKASLSEDPSVVLHKPFTLKALVDALDGVLGRASDPTPQRQ